MATTTHTPGTLRSVEMRAELTLLYPSCLNNDALGEHAMSTQGYWQQLGYYGRVSWDAFGQLRRYLSPEHAARLEKLMRDSDEGRL